MGEKNIKSVIDKLIHENNGLKSRIDELESQIEYLTRELESIHKSLSLNRIHSKQIPCDNNLTGVTEMAEFQHHLRKEWRRAIRSGKWLSLILADIDLFTDFVDQYGNEMGNHCIHQVASALNGVLKRPADMLSIYDKADFAALLPDTDMMGAKSVAKMMRDKVMELEIPHFHSLTGFITISIGLSSIVPLNTLYPSELIITAEKALLEAKMAGRNMVISKQAGFIIPSKTS